MSLQVAKDFERCALQRFKHVIVLTDVDYRILKDFVGMVTIFMFLQQLFRKQKVRKLLPFL